MRKNDHVRLITIRFITRRVVITTYHKLFTVIQIFLSQLIFSLAFYLVLYCSYRFPLSLHDVYSARYSQCKSTCWSDTFQLALSIGYRGTKKKWFIETFAVRWRTQPRGEPNIIGRCRSISICTPKRGAVLIQQGLLITPRINVQC